MKNNIIMEFFATILLFFIILPIYFIISKIIKIVIPKYN